MIDYKKLVREFGKAAFIQTGDIRSDIPQKFIKDNPTARLRVELLNEECDELVEALRDKNKHEVLKELCDVLYVVFGIASTYDLPVEEAFLEVHANNMLKIKNGLVNERGKFVKAKDHPKCDLNHLLENIRYDRIDVV